MEVFELFFTFKIVPGFLFKYSIIFSLLNICLLIESYLLVLHINFDIGDSSISHIISFS